MRSDVVARDRLVQGSGWASIICDRRGIRRSLVGRVIYAVICFTFTLTCACSSSLSSTPPTSSETLSELAAQVDPTDGMASSLGLAADQGFATNDGSILIEGGVDSFIGQDVDSLLFGQAFGDDASWMTLAWPLVGVEAFGESLDLISNLAILDLLAPPDQPSSRTFLEQSCINQGLPEFFCRQRYGS